MSAYRSGASDSADPGSAGEALVERARELFTCLLRGDFQALGPLMTEDVHFEIHAPAIPQFHGSCQGRAEVVATIERNFGQVRERSPEIREVVVQGETVMILARESGEWQADGRPYSVSWLQFLTFRDGRLCLIRKNVA